MFRWRRTPPGDIFMLVRPASGPAEALAPSVRAALARVDKEQLVSVRDVMTLDDVAWERPRAIGFGRSW